MLSSRLVWNNTSKSVRRLVSSTGAALSSGTTTSGATSTTSSSNGQQHKEWIPDVSFDTDLVHGGVCPDEKTGGILTPIHMSTTFVQESVEKYLAKGYSYSRTNNPTVTMLEEKVATTEGGYGAICVGTGMSATSSCLNAFLKAGDHCVITDCSYGGTNRICREQFVPFGIDFSFVDFSNPDTVAAAIRPNTKLIFSESPTNPTLNIADLRAISDIAASHSTADRTILHVCDSTFATPYIMKPLDYGCDLTIQSLTKYYDGHNMGLGGALIASTPELHERIKLVQNMQGNIMSPMTAYLMLQTMKTMGLRVERQSSSAMKIATFLESHPNVERAVYPGLDSHPQKALADQQHRNGMHGGMAYFDVVGGDTSAIKLMDTVKRPWTLCENLGATESIITACAVMTHANMLREDRLKVGITDGFIRISVGIEDPDDLIRSLDEALNQL